MRFQKLGEDVDLLALLHREATVEERKHMFGSLATMYEMKIPLLHVVETKSYYPITNQEVLIDLDLPGEAELVILHSDIVLPSIFRKSVRRKRSK